MKNIIVATVGVIISAFKKEVDPNYKFKFKEREILHEKSPKHVQAVNQHLDKLGVELEKDHLPHFERGTQIDTFQIEKSGDQARKNWKSIKNERKIVNSFHQEATTEQQKGDGANHEKIFHARVGCLAHTLFGSAKASVNPYVSFEEGFEVGVTHDYLDNQRRM